MKILVAPLNWGLGHASRCVPIIRELQRQGAEVLLASDGGALALLMKEFRGIPALPLPTYGVKYPTRNMTLNLAWQSPKILRAILQEEQAVRRLAKQQGVRAIISDNRFGCRLPGLPSVFVTHQVNLLAPCRPLSRLGSFANQQFIDRFDQCWVPDSGGSENLSGKLSHGLPKAIFAKTCYIGALSRLEARPSASSHRYDAIAVLSGPEPQRTLFEAALLRQAALLPEARLLVVQGLADRPTGTVARFANVEIVPYLGTAELSEAISASSVFVGRSGYSTVMDLAKLGKPALLVPTPGQTEQEYLAQRLSAQGFFCCQQQSGLNLKEGLAQAVLGRVLPPVFTEERALATAVSNLLDLC